MTRLLVSVRNAWEAGEALAGGADLIDVKEPRRGSLGAASPATWLDVRQALSRAALKEEPQTGSVPLSAALGELLEAWAAQDPGPAPEPAGRSEPEARGANGETQPQPPAESVPRWQVTALDGYQYAKVGLAGCSGVPAWQELWQAWIESLPRSLEPVAVAYADYRTVASPSPWEILQAASATRVRTLLIDTCQKSSGDLLQRMSACELAEVLASARASGFVIALAGSITLDRLEDVVRFQPDWVAVRGAVCRSARDSALDRELVKRFARQLSISGDPKAGSQNRKNIDCCSARA
jgi:hypothetical protein